MYRRYQHLIYKKLVLLFLTVAGHLVFNYSFAQLPDYHVQLFDASFGVRTYEVKKVIKDQQDFLWILHNDRVQRFDGRHINDFLFEEEPHSILCDRNNRVWVSSGSKLYRFSNNHKGFQVVPVDTIKNLGIYHLFQLPGKELWVLTSKGFYILDSSKQVFRKHPDPTLGNLKQLQNRGIDESTNTLFFSTTDSLIAYSLKTRIRRALPLPQYNIRTVNALSDDLAFVSIWKGILYLYDFSKNEIKTIDLSGHLKNVQDYFIVVFQAVQVSKNKFLLASSKGLVEYDGHTGNFRQLKLFHKGKPLEGNMAFMDLYFDGKGTGWAAYDNYGVISFNKKAGEIGLIRNFETDIAKAWDNHVRNFAEDNKGNLWLATFNGFACLNLNDGTIQPYFATEGATDRLNHFSIRGIVYDGENLILGQTNRGIWLYNPVTKKYKRPGYPPGGKGDSTRRKLEGEFIDQIYTLQNGDYLVAGRSTGYLLHAKTYIIEELGFSGKKENLNFFYQDSKKNIWVGTEKNLYCLDSNFAHRFKITKKQTAGVTNGMFEWNDGSLIIGSNGLYQLVVKDTGVAISKIHPFFDRILVSIVIKDDRNKLWLGTSEGLLRYDMQTRNIESFSNFESIDGNSFYENSFCFNKQGWLFLGSNRGIIYFNPNGIGEQKDSLNIFITGITVNNDDSNYTGGRYPGKLKYFRNDIAFEFVAPYYNNANKLKYRYRLQGLDEEWKANGNNNIVRFHALRPGNYEFQVAASVNGVDWFYGGETIAFSISPPFWKTGWFIILIILVLVTVVYSLYRYQLNKKLEVERLRLGIARDLHDDIGSALSNIHIISSMAARKQQGNGESHTWSKIKESSRAMLENMHDIVWAINPENDTLEQVISKMKEFAGEICEAAYVEYYFNTDARLENIRLTVNKRKDLFLVFKEALNNAVKYSGCSKVHIRLRKNQHNQLCLQVKDNGKGFCKNEIQPGNGLRNMEMRAKEAKGKVTIESVKEKGTLVELVIPLT